jgi:hypothetical protein
VSHLRPATMPAVARDLVGRNVATLVERPKGQAGRPRKSLSLKQAFALLAAVEGTRVHAYIACASRPVSAPRRPARCAGSMSRSVSRRPGRLFRPAQLCGARYGLTAIRRQKVPPERGQRHARVVPAGHRDDGSMARRPQVRPFGGLRPWPDSSSQQSQAPRSAAVLYDRPRVLPPPGDLVLIALRRPARRDQHRPADPVQQHGHPGQRVLHPEPPPALLGNPRQRPALIRIPGRRRARIQDLFQLGNLRRVSLHCAPPAPLDASASWPPAATGSPTSATPRTAERSPGRWPRPRSSPPRPAAPLPAAP